MDYLIMILLFLSAVFLILLVLIQRGRGGGLAGAFGGLGGQSAFGTKAGDLFTRITIVVAALWIVLCAFSVWWFGAGSGSIISSELGRGAKSPPPSQAPLNSKSTAPAPDTTKAAPSKAPADKAAAPTDTGAAPADTKASAPASTSEPPSSPPAETAPDTAK